MNISDADFLKKLLVLFKDQCDKGAHAILPEVMALLIFLAIIEIALSSLLNLNQDHLKSIAMKILKIGFFVWLVINWTGGIDLCDLIFKSFQLIGVKASGANLPVSDPSAIGERGLKLIGNVLNNIIATGYDGAQGAMGLIGTVLIKIVLMLVTVICVFFMAIQLFLTAVEFYILSTLALILVPFGINKHTAFLSEKAIGAIFALSIKIMVLEFIMCVLAPVMEKLGELAGTADPATLLGALLGCLAMAFLTWQAPNLAVSLLSGSPSLHAGTAVGAAAAVGGAAVGALKLGARAVGGTARSAGAVYQAAKVPGPSGQTGFKQTASNLATMANQKFNPFTQGRTNAQQRMDMAAYLKNRTAPAAPSFPPGYLFGNGDRG